MDIEKVASELTLDEKAALLSGTDFMNTNSVPRLDLPTLIMADGPHGLRKQIGQQDNGVSQSEPSTAFPTAAATASSWNTENFKRMGEAIADECLHYGVNILLGPAVNIKKNPRCGRNFEYISEDPLVAGVMGTEFIHGVQGKNVGVSVKHFAANNSEDFRFMGDSIVDERALREIYLKGYEQMVKEAKPYTMMCAYNKINGSYCSENEWLLNEVLRAEWGFDGVVMTDWGAVHNRVDGVRAGLDLEMPGDTHCRKLIIDAVKNGELSEEALNKAVINMLRLIERCSKQQQGAFDKDAHHKLAAKIAIDSAVLLKNGGELPLKKDARLLVIGELFEKMRYQGAGSSMINPTQVTTPKNAFDECRIKYEYQVGYLENSVETNGKLLTDALNAASKYEKVVVFAGLTDYIESEGCDRGNLLLPKNQVELIEGLIKLGKKIVLVLFGGSPVELPFVDSIDAILNMYLPGQNGGEACKSLLFGEANPSGKLAETWPQSYADVPFGENYSKTVNEVYKESIFVGYRYYNTKQKQVLFPFGHGVSYTTFDYSQMVVKDDGESITVTCSVTNTGSCNGAEVVQLYVKNNLNSKVFKANKELRGFAKVYLQSGETKNVSISFKKSDLSYYNTTQKAWILENGIYEIQIGASSEDIRLLQNFEIIGKPEFDSPYTQNINGIYKDLQLENVTDSVFEQMSGLKIPDIPPTLPLRLESRFSDFKKTFMGRILFNAVASVAKKQRIKALKMPDGAQKDNALKGASFLHRIFESNSIRSLSMSAGKSMPINIAEAFVLLGNGKLIKGIRRIMKKEVLPPLPKDRNNQ